MSQSSSRSSQSPVLPERVQAEKEKTPPPTVSKSLLSHLISSHLILSTLIFICDHALSFIIILFLRSQRLDSTYSANSAGVAR